MVLLGRKERNIIIIIVVIIISTIIKQRTFEMLPPMGWDYAVFAVFIIASTIYPIWDELRGRQGGASKQNFVFAAGRVSVFAIMMSLARGTIGVRSVIGKCVIWGQDFALYLTYVNNFEELVLKIFIISFTNYVF